MSSIVTFTMNPAIDANCSVDRVVPEHKLRCSRPQHEPGGGGINVSRAVHELGGTSRALWVCGGTTGDLLAQLLDREGIEHDPIPIEDMVRQNLIVYEESSTQQYRFGMPGPQMTHAEAERCLRRLHPIDPPPEYLVLSGSLPPGVDADFYAEAVRQAPSDCRVILDTGGPALRRALDAGVYLIKPNLRELGELADREIERDEEIEATARELIGAGRVEVVMVSLGAAGAVVVTADFVEHVRSPTVPIRSKVGAGDSMVAGIVHGLDQGRSIREAARFGVAAGAAAVMTPGTSLCRRADTERLYAQIVAELPH